MDYKYEQLLVLQRRKQRLKQNLTQEFGQIYEGIIDNALKRAENQISQGQTYQEAYQTLYNQVRQEISTHKGTSNYREVPIQPKKQIELEWAAVYRLQDEAIRHQDDLQRKQQIEKQKQYNKELGFLNFSS